MSFHPSRLVVISYRLPVVAARAPNGVWSLRPGSGGLVTALAPALEARGGLWGRLVGEGGRGGHRGPVPAGELHPAPGLRRARPAGLDCAKELMLEAVKGVEGVLADPAPDVLLVALAASTVNRRRQREGWPGSDSGNGEGPRPRGIAVALRELPQALGKEGATKDSDGP